MLFFLNKKKTLIKKQKKNELILMFKCIYMRLCVYVCALVCKSIYVRFCVYVCIYVCMYACLHVRFLNVYVRVFL